MQPNEEQKTELLPLIPRENIKKLSFSFDEKGVINLDSGGFNDYETLGILKYVTDIVSTNMQSSAIESKKS